MRVTDLEQLFDYSYWANGKLFAVLTQLTPEQFTQPIVGSYESIRNTLVHVLSAEWGWLDRCGGRARGAKLNPDDYPTMESVVDAWTRVEGYVREFLSQLEDDDLARRVEFTLGSSAPCSMAIGELLQHAFVHGAHHRGQLALLLRVLGYAPGNFDMLFYCGDRRA